MQPPNEHAALSPVRREPWLGKLDFLWLEVTSKCNLECTHCYADSGPFLPLVQGMSYGNWLDVLKQAFALGCRSVQFIGGEPTLCPDLPRLIHDARKIGFDFVEVYTNGTLLSRALRESLVKGDVDLAFSVYGSRPEVHDAVTGRPGSLVKTLDNIHWALDARLRVRASIIEMPSNSEDIKATKSMIRKLGVRSIAVDPARGVGRARALVSVKNLNPMDELCGDCWRGKLAVDPSGNVFPCVFSRFCQLGHVSQSLASILQGKTLYSFRKEVWMTNGRCAPTRGAKLTKLAKPTKRKPKGCAPTRRKPKAGCAPTRRRRKR